MATIDCNKTRRKETTNVFTVQSTRISPNFLCHASPTPDAGYNPRHKRTKAVLLSNTKTLFPSKLLLSTLSASRVNDMEEGMEIHYCAALRLCVYMHISTSLVCSAIGDTGVHHAFYRSHPPTSSTISSGVVTTQDASPPPTEDSVDYQGNLQAIQNLMGLHADTHAAITPILSQLSLSSPVSTTVLTILTLLIPSILFLSPFIPTRLIAFFEVALPPSSELPMDMVTLPNAHTNPPNSPSDPEIVSKTIHHGQCIFTSFLLEGIGLINRLKSLTTFALSTNSLTDRIRNAELREVELWENERCDSQTAARFASVVANAGHDANASAPSIVPPSTSTSRIGRKLSESFTFSSSPSTSPSVKKAKKASKSNTNTHPARTQTQTRNALLDTLAPLPPFALIPPLPATAMGDLVEEGGIEATLELEKRERGREQKDPEQSEYKENQNQKRPSHSPSLSMSMLPPKPTFSSSSNYIQPNPVSISMSPSTYPSPAISPEMTQAIQTFKKCMGTGDTGSMGTNAIRRTMSGAHGHGEYADEVKENSGRGSGYEAGSGPGPAALGPGMISDNKYVLTKTNSTLFPFPRPFGLCRVVSCVSSGLTQNLINLTFSLAPGWKFIETEDWRVDYDAGAGATSGYGATLKGDGDKVSSPLDMDLDDDEDRGDGDEDGGDDGGDEDDFENGNGKSGKWLDITFKAGVLKRTRPIGPSHVRQAQQSQEERQEQWEQEQQERKRKLEISFFIVFGVSVNVGFSFGGRGGSGVGGVNDEVEDKGWMCGGDEGGFDS
ncbi:hypothetical protein D9758_016568 [Tetrapyrgos nigripes]|uniref:Uncharacterized protein n=1 Tax=Tetrapyrgos nigripes TaxID=182062 RepID=A0A8H5FCR5_9AGAR|nr:hypothetical protein D9758_016568 [Tetrapyrgos nigripes]